MPKNINTHIFFNYAEQWWTAAFNIQECLHD